MIVGFHSPTMTLRGSEIALWDYALQNESVLGNSSLICHRVELGSEDNPVFQKMRHRFPLLSYRTRRELAQKLARAGAGVLYQIKAGPFDRFLVEGLPNSIHAMFLSDEFHGDRFAYVSAWASRVMTGGEKSFVPHVVPRLEGGESLRGRLGIPKQARVFGRHGAPDTFNIPFVRRCVAEHALRYPEDHFCFLNTSVIPGTERLRNVHYLAGTASDKEKAAFLATCDAMLHARWHGETFGLAVGEFAVLGKPVITFGGSRERAHLDMLGEKALVYRTAAEVRSHLSAFRCHTVGGTAYETWSDPHAVMKIFKERFLDHPR